MTLPEPLLTVILKILVLQFVKLAVPRTTASPILYRININTQFGENYNANNISIVIIKRSARLKL